MYIHHTQEKQTFNIYTFFSWLQPAYLKLLAE